jgi:hypothetical protein
VTQPSFSQGSLCIARTAGTRRIRLLASAAAVLQLTACGGSDAPDAPSGERAQVQVQVLAAAPAPAAAEPAPVETAAHTCVRQVNQALKTNAPKVNADCLAGTYVGVDARGKNCALLIAASNGRFRFVERDKSLSVEADTTAARAQPPAYTIERADVEMGQIGLLLSRRSAVARGDVETLELASGETRHGPLGLASASFSRVKAGDVTIVRCYFDT